jgi:Zn-dependent M16 (insulinase) family peptidase
MGKSMSVRIVRLSMLVIVVLVAGPLGLAQSLPEFKQNQVIGDFRVANLYADSEGTIVGGKFWHTATGAPIYLLQIDTAPQTFMWVDVPADSNNGLAHSLEHLLVRKGTKGRYLSLLQEMRLSKAGAATFQDYNFFCLTSGTGMAGFLEQFHAWVDALYRPDFTDLEAEREFYHWAVTTEPGTQKKTLVEQGTVYNEEQTGQGIYTYYYELNKEAFGSANPFSHIAGGEPGEMRNVTPLEIRQFHAKHYRLGPGTGFIFVIDPKENVPVFLGHIGKELRGISDSGRSASAGVRSYKEPKYPYTPSSSTEIKIYPFPGASEGDRGVVRMEWRPERAGSQTDVRLLQLFLRALGNGEQSLLYKSLIDSNSRELDSGATNIYSGVFLENSPWIPVSSIDLSGIPGNHISSDKIERLRKHILAKIQMVSAYPENSPALTAFNELVMSSAKAWHRSERVWIKSAPRFDTEYKTDWKEYLNYLEMDPSFVRSLSDDTVWENVESQIRPGKNIWRDVVREFHLLDTPYATASVPSPELVTKMDQGRKERIRNRIEQLKKEFGGNDDQQALTQFEQAELKKTVEIDRITAQVKQPKFTDHPPLTADDDIQYRQFQLGTVPVIAVLFERDPTIDVGLSFDLKKIPKRLYKYLPILPRCIDSLGLKTPDRMVSYSDLLAETQKDLNEFSISYETNPTAERANLAIRASVTSSEELGRALALIKQMLQFSRLDLSSADRLRDLVLESQAEDDRYGKGEDSNWLWNPAYAFRHQEDVLFLALYSQFTRAHWNGRLRWLLHQSATQNEIDRLGQFAKDTLASFEGMSTKEISERISKLEAKGLELELLQYWEKNIFNFSQDELVEGFRRLTAEVQQDLATGPVKTIEDLKELLAMAVDRGALKIDLTLDPNILDQVRPLLSKFLASIPAPKQETQRAKSDLSQVDDKHLVLRTIEKRAGLSGEGFPWYVGFEDPSSPTGGAVFSADLPGYSQLDRKSVMKILSSKLASGIGPHSFHMKTIEAGLAYANSVASSPDAKLLYYYADRSPDLAALIQLVNSIAAGIPKLRDQSLIDYALQKAFPIQRSMSTFANRGKSLAADIYDGNEPEKVRRFSEALLKLREDPKLLSEVTQAGLPSIGSVLLMPEFREQQRTDRSIFFLVGPERLLSDAEKKLAIPKLLRLYRSDFWIDFTDQGTAINNGDVATPSQHNSKRQRVMGITPVKYFDEVKRAFSRALRWSCEKHSDSATAKRTICALNL